MTADRVYDEGALNLAAARAEAVYTQRCAASRELWKRACDVLPGGNTRTVVYWDPFPLTFVRGEGARLVDADGHAYVDMLGDYSAGLYGHSHPAIRAAIERALADGMTLGGLNRYEARLAELICARFPSCDKIRFTNSGTEANLMAITAARIATGRPEVLVFDGGYHGGVFAFTSRDNKVLAPFPWRFGTYNDLEATLPVIEKEPEKLAAIIVEPMMGGAGAIPGTPEFLRGLREVAAKHGVALIFDEVMTSRMGAGGVQGKLGIRPDLTTFGKYLGGGMNFGAFGGAERFMAIFDSRRGDSAIGHAGTFNNNVITMAAGVAGLTEVFTPAAAEALHARGEALRARINAATRDLGAPFQATGIGSIMALHPQEGAIRRTADLTVPQALRKLLHLEMLTRGYNFARRGYVTVSLPLTDAELDGFVAALLEVVGTVIAPLVARRGAARAARA
jgi:glutamate-1-semialdehyde 2,1-aminomutase